MKPFLLVTAIAALTVFSFGAAEAKDSDGAMFDAYVSGMAWPMQESTLRAQMLHRAIDGAVNHGDPPLFREIGVYCQSFRRVETTGRRLGIGSILRIVPVASLVSAHRRLANAYAASRTGCVHAWAVARAALDNCRRRTGAGRACRLDGARASARTDLTRFDRSSLRSFTTAARDWRTAVLRNARELRVVPPRWLERLSLGP